MACSQESKTKSFACILGLLCLLFPLANFVVSCRLSLAIVSPRAKNKVQRVRTRATTEV